MQKVAELKRHFPNAGRVEWIGVRSQRGSEIDEKSFIEAVKDNGLVGDKAGTRPGGKRQVTIFQAEYLPVVRALLPDINISYPDLRRNIVVSGINLNALKECQIKIGAATLEVTGFCHPCSKLEAQLGKGVFNALRGHGGLTAKVIESGLITVNDDVHVL